jgi:hypothetical protein
MTQYIWAVDPGSRATGVAVVHSENPEFWEAEQFADPKDAFFYIDARTSMTDVFIIEMYRSAGYLTNHGQRTIEAIGWLKNAIEYFYDKPPIMVPEQARLAGRREAAELMGMSIAEMEQNPQRKDAFSALSHCCSYRRELPNG